MSTGIFGKSDISMAIDIASQIAFKDSVIWEHILHKITKNLYEMGSWYSYLYFPPQFWSQLPYY
jgi:hypothetical protein